MGKISAAPESNKMDRSTKIIKLPKRDLERPPQEDSKMAVNKEAVAGNRYSHKLVAFSAPGSVDAENFKILRTQILFAKKRKKPRVLMITSTFPGEGKTFVSANLAVSIALGIDQYVLLVDADMRRPSLGGIFGITDKEGLHEHLVGEKQLNDIILRTEVDKLSILPAGKIPPNPSELLSSSIMENFVEEVKARYDDRYIIFDSAPIRFFSEAHAMVRHVDGIIFVVMAKKSPRKDVLKAVDELGKENILGLVFNGYNQVYKNYRKYYHKYYNTE